MTCARTAAWEANSGGPRSRSRIEHLTSTVLGQDDERLLVADQQSGFGWLAIQ